MTITLSGLCTRLGKEAGTIWNNLDIHRIGSQRDPILA